MNISTTARRTAQGLLALCFTLATMANAKAQCTLEPLPPYAPVPSITIPIDASPDPSTADLNSNVISGFFSSDCAFIPPPVSNVNFYTAAVGGSPVNAAGAGLSFDCSSVGSTLTYWVTVGAGGNTSPRRQISVSVIDNTAPTVTMPAGSPFARNTTTACGYTIVGTEFDPTSIVDNCPNPTSEYKIDAGPWVSATTLNNVVINGLGSHTIQWRITDASLSNQTLSSILTVNITDNVLPTITCPGNAVRNTDANVCTYTIAGIEFNPTIADNCTVASSTYTLTGATTAGPVTAASNSLNGIVLNKGVTNITWSVTDGSGNVANCGPFTVTVNDMQAPAIVASAASGVFHVTPAPGAAISIGTSTAPGAPLCDGIYRWNHPTISDNCTPLTTPPSSLKIEVSGATTLAITSVTPGANFTQTFNLGASTVVYTAEDNNGRTSTVSFTVTVTDDVTPVLSFSFAGTLDSLDVPSYTQPVDPGTCGATLTIERPSLAILGPGCTPTPCSNYSFSDCGVVTGPIQGPANINGTNNPVFLNAAPPLNTTDPVNRYATLTFPVGRTVIPYWFVDNNGNVSSVYIIVQVSESEFPAANCIASTTLALGASGVVTLNPASLNNGSADNCGSVVFSVDPVNEQFDCSEVGPHVVTLYVEDYSGNVSSCNTNVNVVDNTPPQVLCPLPITVSTSAGVCTATGVTGANLSAGTINSLNPGQWADNCPNTTIDWTITGVTTGSGSGAATVSGQTFNKGVSTVKYTLDDPSNPPVNCTFTVTVADNQAPVATNCPPNITVSANIAPGCSYKKPNSATCIADVNTPANQWCGTVNFNDNCEGASSVSNLASLNQTYSLGNNTITVTKTDAAGNVGNCTFTINVVDQSAPTAICKDVTAVLNGAGTVTVSAKNNLNNGSSDNCYLDLIYTLSLDNGMTFTPSATFNCAAVGPHPAILKVQEDGGTQFGLSTPCTITVVDQTAPVITCPTVVISALGVNGLAQIKGDTITGLVVSDNCTSAANMTYGLSFTAGGPYGILEVDCDDVYDPLNPVNATLSVKDAQGNETTCVIEVKVLDVTAPSFSISNSGQIVDCNSAMTYPAPVFVISDVCDGANLTPTAGITTTIPGLCPGDYTLLTTYTVVDLSGNASQAVYTVNVVDNASPIIGGVTDATILLSSNFPSCFPTETYTATITDNCASSAFLLAHTTWVIVYSDGFTTAGTGAAATGQFSTGANVITWTSVDECGNVQNYSITVTVDDVAAPEFVPAYKNVYCPTTTTVFPFNNTPNTCGYTYSWNRPSAGSFLPIFQPTVTDCALTFPVNDFNITETIVHNGTTNIVPSQAYDPFSFLNQAVPTVLNLPVGNTLFTYTATDGEGNTSTCSFTVKVTDTQAPVLTCPTNITLNTICPTATVPDYRNMVTISDNCLLNIALTQSKQGVLLGNNAVIGYLPGPLNPPTDNSTFEIVFTATDGTNAAAPCTTIVTLNDSDAPIPTTSLLPIVSDCGFAIVSAPTAFPNCGTVPLIYGTPGGVSATPFEVVGGNVLKYKVTGTGNFFITWSYNDGNGNVSTQLQQLTINADTEPPIAKCITTQKVITLSSTYPASATITPQSIDADNGSFSVNGSHDPDFCTLPTPPSTVTTSAVGLALSQSSFTCADLTKTSVTLTATDAAGNTATCTASIKVVDVNPPVYQNLPQLPLQPLTVECGDPIPVGAEFIAIDNCNDTIHVTPLDIPVANPNICGQLATKSFIRTWSVTDNNNPPVTITQDILIKDTKAPVWQAAAPNSQTASTAAVSTVCQAPITLQANNTWVSDACAAFGSLTFQNSIVGPGVTYNAGCGPTNACASGIYNVGTHVVTFTATDPCGNSSTHTVTVVVKDATPPTAVCFNGISIALNLNGQAIVTPNLLNNNSSDNCSASLSFKVQQLQLVNGDTIGSPSNQLVFDCDEADSDTEYPVILIVTDGGGNSSFCETRVVVQDNVTPTITCPADVTVQCGDELDPYENNDLGIAGAVDNCPSNVDTTYSDAPLTVVSYTCPSIVRTWRAEDLAGNVSTCTQLIEIHDTIAPVFNSPLPQNDTITCFENGPAPVLHATDNCSPTDSILVTFVEVKSDSVGVCGKYDYKVTRTWTALDKCGNTAVHEQVLVIRDTIAPQFNLPPNKTINQQSANALPTTNCTVPIVYNLGAAGVLNECAPLTELTVNYITFEPQLLNPITPNVLDISGNYPVGETKVIFSVTDPCGNEGVDTLTINIVDNSLPIAICNNNVVISLGSNGSASIEASDIDLNSNDNCGIDTMFLSKYDFDCGDLGFNTDTLTVVDVHGNSNFCVVNVQVTLGATTGFTLSATGTPETFFGSADGTATAVATGGTGSFNYQWSTQETVSDITGLSAGTYTVTVTDTNTGCLAIDTAIIVAGAKIVITVGDGDGCQGDTISIPVIVDNFISVTGFSLGLTLSNPAVGTITGLTNVNAGLTGLVPAVNSVFWTQPSLIPTTLPNGSVLFNVEVALSGSAGLGETGDINASALPALVFVQNGNIQSPSVTFNAGSATVSCSVPDLELAGDVFTWKAPVKPIPGVTLTLGGSSSGTDITALPDADYNFFVSAGDNTVTSASKAATAKNNRINVGDMLGIQAHAALQVAFNNPYQWVAADINGDQRVNLVDYALVQTYVLGSSAHFPGTQTPPDWKFIPESHVFQQLPVGNPAPPALNPLNNPVPPSTIVHTNVTADFLDDNFVGVLMGDVNGDVIPSFIGNGGTDFSTADVLKFRLDNRTLEAGETITVPFKAIDFRNAQAYQMTIAFDPEVLELRDIQAGALPGLSQGNFGTSRLAEGMLSTLWVGSKPTTFDDNEVLFTLTFKVMKSAASLSGLLRSSDDVTAALAIDQTGNTIPVDFEFVSSVATGEADHKVFALYQNQPNPFTDETNITFRLPEAGRATLRILSAEGRLVKLVIGEFAEGMNSIKFRKDELGSKGVFYYELETAKQSDRKKMILID